MCKTSKHPATRQHASLSWYHHPTTDEAASPLAPAGFHHPTTDEPASPVAPAGFHHPTSDEPASPVAPAGFHHPTTGEQQQQNLHYSFKARLHMYYGSGVFTRNLLVWLCWWLERSAMMKMAHRYTITWNLETAWTAFTFKQMADTRYDHWRLAVSITWDIHYLNVVSRHRRLSLDPPAFKTSAFKTSCV